MKRNQLLFFTVLGIVLLLTSCNKKQRAIDSLSEFVEKVEQHASEYTEEDWAEADKEYDELIAEIDMYEYSGHETKRIAELKGKYLGIKTKYSVNKLIEGIDKAAKEIKGTIEGFTEGILGGSDKYTE